MSMLIYYVVAGEDYEDPENATIVFQSGFQGHAGYWFSLTIIDDPMNEPSEVFALILSSNDDGVDFTRRVAIVIIVDDDPRKFNFVPACCYLK